MRGVRAPEDGACRDSDPGSRARSCPGSPACDRLYPAAMPVASSAEKTNVSIAALAVIGSRVGSSS